MVWYVYLCVGFLGRRWRRLYSFFGIFSAYRDLERFGVGLVGVGGVVYLFTTMEVGLVGLVG